MTVTATLRRLDAELGDLIERHGRGRSLDEFAAYSNDPIGFIREVLGGEPWSRQVEIAESVRDSPLVVVRSANAVGKDWIAARLALWWVYCRRGLALITGPTERQVREVVMGEVARAFHTAKDLPGELYQMALRLGREEKAGILAFTSTEASKLTGFHAPRVMAILTEAQGCEGFAWEGLLACVTGSGDRVLAVGNPLAPSGRFYTVSRPKSGWRAIRIAADEHPNLREGYTVIPGGPSPEFAARIAREYGRQSGIYQARVLGEFPDQGEESLFRRSWLEAAAERLERWCRDHAGCEPILAVDVGRHGPDLSVCAVLRGPVVTRIESWGGCDLMETVDRVRALAGEEGVEPGGSGVIVVDVVGLGAGVADRLVELGYRVVEFNGGSRASDAQRFANTRAESYWLLRDALEVAALALPPDEELLEELLAQTWTPTAEGRIALPPKETIKGQLGRSPNKADAVTMGVWWRVVAATPEPWSEVVLGAMGDPLGFFTELDDSYVIDEDRAAGWEPIRW
jgi:hypothetical protein